MIEHIATSRAPLPKGHYAQATKANGFVFVSGQLPFLTDGSGLLAEGLDAQVGQALTNLEATLSAAQSSIDRLGGVQIYVSDIGKGARVNELDRAFIGDPAPARTVVPCSELHYGAHIEISAIELCADEVRA